MEVLSEVIASLVILVIGYGIGYLSKGVNITIIRKEPEIKDGDYNPSLAQNIPEDVRNYYQNSGGMNQW